MNWFKRFGRFTRMDWSFFLFLAPLILFIGAIALIATLTGAPVVICVLFWVVFIGQAVFLVHTINYVTNI